MGKTVKKTKFQTSSQPSNYVANTENTSSSESDDDESSCQKLKSTKEIEKSMDIKPAKRSIGKTMIEKNRHKTKLLKISQTSDSESEDVSNPEIEYENSSSDESDPSEINTDKQASSDFSSDNEVDIREGQDMNEEMEMTNDSESDEDDNSDTDNITSPIEAAFTERDGANTQSEQDEYSAIRKELADIPFEDLLKIKEKVGVKNFNKILHGNVDDKPKQTSFKRNNKHRPREMSAKRPVSVLRNKAETKKRVSRDPRFDDLSGQFSENHFTKNYSFIEAIKEEERKVVKEEMKQAKNDAKKHELKNLLNRMQQEQELKAMKRKKDDLEKTYREKEKELVREGKTPYFLKKSDKKTLELAMKFKELKQSGRLDRYMSKKRKKVAQKQRKKMPSKLSGHV